MSTMLSKILETKRTEVAARKSMAGVQELDRRAGMQTPPRGFRAALDAKQFGQPTMSFGKGLDPVQVAPEVRAVLEAYLAARTDDPAYPDGLATAFGLFLPIACRYGFRDAGRAGAAAAVQPASA